MVESLFHPEGWHEGESEGQKAEGSSVPCFPSPTSTQDMWRSTEMLFEAPGRYCLMSCQWKAMTVNFLVLLRFPGGVIGVAENAAGLRTNGTTVGCVGARNSCNKG